MKFRNDSTRSQHLDMGANMFTAFRTQRPDHRPDDFGPAWCGHRNAESDLNVNANGWDSHGGKTYVGHFNKCDQSLWKTNRLFNETTGIKEQCLSRKWWGWVLFGGLKQMVDIASGCHELIAIPSSEQSLRRVQFQTHGVKPTFNHCGEYA